MCMVHNSIFRGYNSIYHQAPHVAEADKADFVGYCLTWHKFTKTHAENEETSLFPKIEELLEDKTIWEESHREHGTSEPVWGAAKDGTDNLTGNSCVLRRIHAQHSQVPRLPSQPQVSKRLLRNQTTGDHGLLPRAIRSALPVRDLHHRGSSAPSADAQGRECGGEGYRGRHRRAREEQPHQVRRDGRPAVLSVQLRSRV